MLVIYRTNEGFEGDVVTVMSGDADLTAALVGEDVAVLVVELATADAAALVLSPEKYVVAGELLCERADQGEALAGARDKAAGRMVIISVQTEAVVALKERLIDEVPVRKAII